MLRKMSTQPLLAVSGCVRELQIEAASTKRHGEVDIPVVLQLRDPDILAGTLPEQEIIAPNPRGYELLQDMPAQYETHAVGSMIGVEPLLQEKYGLSISEAELGGRRLAVKAKQPKF